MDLRQVLLLARITVGNPKDGATTVLSYQFKRQELVEMAILVAVIGVIAATVESALLPRTATGMFATELSSPMFGTALQLTVMAIMAIAIFHGGRVFGGNGTLDGAILLVIWLQFVNFLLQLAGFFLMLALAVPFNLVMIVSAVISTWLLVNFIAVLHGFQSLGTVFGGVIGLYVAVSVVVAVLLSIFGLVPGGT